ncbi:hypothetical protein SAMN05445850_8030 [Paraburkholderia tuberum]|uniref:Uncharacterized protein n=1 Tax=Paraburkholderia tuberum TaxID=157910 RepID=A0A1H1KHU0_9BURK|nr:hypothetical protein SAMN05445850_8030 [Paraburkholderia tuberum]
MTESHTRQPLSPADYIRLVARPRHKLLAYAALIRELMEEEGFNDYRIWRYLVDEYGVKIGRTTAHRFCTALRAGRIPAENGGAVVLSEGPAAPRMPPHRPSAPPASAAPPQEAQHVEHEGRTNDAVVARAHAPRQLLPGDASGPSVEVGPSRSEAVRSHEKGGLETAESTGLTPTAPRNDAPVTAAFNLDAHAPAPRMEVAEGTPDWVPGDVLKTFKISSPRATRMLEAYRRRAAEKDDADTAQQGPQSDEHDDVREQ